LGGSGASAPPTGLNWSCAGYMPWARVRWPSSRVLR
jgi:hypothetical protein